MKRRRTPSAFGLPVAIAGLILSRMGLCAAAPCAPEPPVNGQAASSQAARDLFKQATEVAGSDRADRFQSAIAILRRVGWAPVLSRGANRPQTPEDLDLSNAIWLALARSYYQVGGYCESARHYGYLLGDKYSSPEVLPEIEAALKAWDSSPQDRVEMESTLRGLVTLVDAQLGRLLAQQFIRHLEGAGLTNANRVVIEDMAIELYATRYWPVNEFEESEAGAISLLIANLAPRDRAAWQAICRAYGFSANCKSLAELEDPIDERKARQMFPGVARDIPKEYDFGIPVLLGGADASPNRGRAFSALLSRVAREGNAKPEWDDYEGRQSLYRWKAAFFLDRNDLASARFAASLIRDRPELDKEKSFRKALLRELKVSRADTASLLTRGLNLNPNSHPRSMEAAGDVETTMLIFTMLAETDHEDSLQQLARLSRVVLERNTAVAPDALRAAAKALSPETDCKVRREDPGCNLAGKLYERATSFDENARFSRKEGIATPFEGDLIVQGTLPADHPDFILQVTIWDSATCSSTEIPPFWNRIQQSIRYIDSGQRQYVIPLQVPLKAGQCIQIGSGSSKPENRAVETGTRGWARQRLYGRIGYEIFAPEVAHSTSPAFFGSLGYDLALRAETVPSESRRSNRWLPGIHAYLEGRIESISVSTKVTSETLSEDLLGARCGSRNTCASSPRSGRAGELGFYLPWLIPRTSWFYQGSAVGWFLAPLIKVGTEARFGGDPLSGTKVDVTIQNTALKGEELRSGPFSYRAVGARLGQFRYFSSRTGTRYFLGQTAPVLMGNLDFTIGHYQAFSLPPYQNFSTLPWRREFRANFAISPLPVFFGFFWNGGAGPHDYRFFIGLRYEFAQLGERLRRQHLRQ